MRVEILIFIIAGLIIANIYTEGKVLKKLLSFKKYYQMIGVAFGAFMLYILLKRNPLRAKQVISSTNDYIKYLPIDKNTTNMISPILDFTSRQDFSSDVQNGRDAYNYPVIPMPNQNHTVSENRMLQSGKKATKRKETKEKKRKETKIDRKKETKKQTTKQRKSENFKGRQSNRPTDSNYARK